MQIIRFLQLATACLSFTSCIVPDVSGHIEERMEEPKAMPHWNQFKIWHRVADDPITYLPTGYSKHQARGESDGVWVIDERENLNKRLFVPYGGANGYSFSILKAEAEKACQWTPFAPNPKMKWDLVFPMGPAALLQPPLR